MESKQKSGMSKKATIAFVGITAISNAPSLHIGVMLTIVTIAGITAQAVLDAKKD